MVVTEFQNEFRFLSNFWPAPTEFEGILFPTSEHAYASAKSLDVELRRAMCDIKSPGLIKRFAKGIKIRKDWKEIRVGVMRDVLRDKFTRNKELGAALIATGDAILQEGNSWGDTFWGISPIGSGIGNNTLGILLMELRDELRSTLD